MTDRSPRSEVGILRDGLPYSLESVQAEIETACYENIEQAIPVTEERLDWMINTIEQLAAEVDRLRKLLEVVR